MPASATGERRRFLRSFLASPRQVGAVLPTSRRTVGHMLELAPLERARCVIELGAGTGVYTREILKRVGADARLLAFELDPSLAAGLESETRDPRLEVINDSAANMARYLVGSRADVIVSALPFASLPGDLGREILRTSRDVLGIEGVMVLIQYTPLIQAELRRTFGSVRRRTSILNVPPAFLYACAGAPRDDS